MTPLVAVLAVAWSLGASVSDAPDQAPGIEVVVEIEPVIADDEPRATSDPALAVTGGGANAAVVSWGIAAVGAGLITVCVARMADPARRLRVPGEAASPEAR